VQARWFESTEAAAQFLVEIAKDYAAGRIKNDDLSKVRKEKLKDLKVPAAAKAKSKGKKRGAPPAAPPSRVKAEVKDEGNYRDEEASRGMKVAKKAGTTTMKSYSKKVANSKARAKKQDDILPATTKPNDGDKVCRCISIRATLNHSQP
jgi:hypothetical protein